MKWIELTNEEQLEWIRKDSNREHQLIFKHSTRCSISSVARSRLERSEIPEGIQFHLLDLIKYRSLSNLVEEHFQVQHESPQVLLIKNGQCIYDESHSGITMDEIKQQL